MRYLAGVLTFSSAVMFFSNVGSAGTQLYIRVELCKNDVCIERHLPVPDEVNEVQCIYGAMSTVVTWAQQNMPSYTIKQWRCTRHKREES